MPSENVLDFGTENCGLHLYYLWDLGFQVLMCTVRLSIPMSPEQHQKITYSSNPQPFMPEGPV